MIKINLKCKIALSSLPEITIKDIFNIINESHLKHTILNQYDKDKKEDNVNKISLVPKISVNEEELEDFEIEVEIDDNSSFKNGYELRAYFSYKQYDENDVTLKFSDKLEFKGFYYYDKTIEIKFNVELGPNFPKTLKAEELKAPMYQVLKEMIKNGEDIHLFAGVHYRVRELLGIIKRVSFDDGEIKLHIREFYFYHKTHKNFNINGVKITAIFDNLVNSNEFSFIEWKIEIPKSMEV